MVISVGTKNSAKIAAVTEITQEYPFFVGATVKEIEASSDVADQPKSLEEVVQGAVNRAKNAFTECDYSVGIESGFMAVPQAKSGYMNVCVAVIYDGKESYLGLSPAFETPNPEMMRLVMEEGMAFDQAALKVGFTNDPHIGKNSGIIGVLTDGKIDRKEFTKEALRMAVPHLTHPA